MLIDDFDDLMQQDEVSWRLPTFDLKGDETTAGTGGTAKAKVRGGQSLKLVKDGKEVTASVTALLDGVYGLTTAHRFILPERFSPRDPEPIKVDVVMDFDGADHEKIYFLG